MDVVKRPHDTRFELTVQDLCVLDQFQNFGPEFELILCSDGKNLLNLLSSPSHHSHSSLQPTQGRVREFGKVQSCPTVIVGSGSTVSRGNKTPIRAHHSEVPMATSPDCGVLSPASDTPSLLSICYQHVTSLSPEHPAVKDVDVREWAGQGAWPGEGEPDIHKMSVHCTGVDVLGE